ncbi:hypothetical protein pqer_cds_909 [Pandoravirus quercus]|uniref:F-box domain-containing protein n=1 Tax=Pandoravirus quercus TaxID=2107709 RepID=A0A2U7UA60_9VIRU|nr:hypothetical protein pqer_cds_909 [Pandoravirus quercus]AVK75331.1 hypothetical protein pqer_cds_909 [Pandoravirus quercus]
MQTRCTWSHLPDEVVYEIATHCTVAALVALARADHRTRSICLDDRLWKRLYWRDFQPCRSTPGHETTMCLVDVARAYAGGDILSCASPWLGDGHTDAHRPLGRYRSTPSWEWRDLFAGGLSLCLHHWPPEALVDHRWAYASLLAPKGLFGRFPDTPLRRVGRIRANPRAFGFADYKSPHEMVYIGDLDAEHRPHGWGTAIIMRGRSTVVHRVSGQWSCGRVDGWASTWSNHSGQPSYFQGYHAKGEPHGRGLLITHSRIYDGDWQRGQRTGIGVARTTEALTRYGPESDSSRTRGVIYRRDGSVAFVGRFDGGRLCHGSLYDPTGALLYQGDLSTRLRITGHGTVYLADGTALSGHMGPADDRYRATITYPNGDTIHCLLPCIYDNGPRDPVVVFQFIYSPVADGDLAGRAIDGPWQVLTTPPDTGATDGPFGGRLDKNDMDLSNHADIITQYVDDTCEYDPQLGAMRALCNFVFWPRSDGTAEGDTVRRRFLNHMAAHHGGRWLVCRQIAHASQW